MKIEHIWLTAFVLALLLGSRTAQAEGWSLLHPFSTTKTEAKPPATSKPARKPVKKEPSTLDKMGTGTKNFFTGVGDKLSLKKSPPAKTGSYTTSSGNTNLGSQSSKIKSSSGSGSSWNPFHKEEPKPPKTLSDFVGMKRPE